MTPLLTIPAGLVRRSWRRRIVRRSFDGSSALAGRRLLVLAPHPDDETFGCGALIARVAAAGEPVTVLVATDGSRSTTSNLLRPAQIAALRRAELRTACAHLGATEVVELGHGDGSLAHLGPALTADVAAAIDRYRPDVVLVPCAQDHHPDHRALHAAAVSAVRRSAPRPILLGYPVWTWHAAPVFAGSADLTRLPQLWAWAARQALWGRWWRVPTRGYLDRKRAAVEAYASQVGNYTGEPDWSSLTPGFVAAFLAPEEVFLPVDVSCRR